MSGYEPKVGEWVVARSRVEGRIVRVGDHDFEVIEEGYPVQFPISSRVWHYEHIDPPRPPLPTTPGSVIRNRPAGSLMACRRDGRWRDLETGAVRSPSEFDHWLYDVQVIFDAGAES